MLKRIRLKDFKSFMDEEVEISPLTLLVGANASGKSNFLDAMRILQGLASGLTLGEVLNGERQSRPGAWPGIRGRAEEAARLGIEMFTLDTNWASSEAMEVHHRITCRTSPYTKIEEEILQDAGGRRVFSSEKKDRSMIGNLDVKVSPESEYFSEMARFSAPIQRLQFLRMNPNGMRGYGRRDELLGEDGKNLSEVLARFCDDEEEKLGFIAWLTEFCAPEVEGIDFLDVKELGDVMAVFVEKGGKRISARSISDGTLHFLGTLLALRTAEAGSVILVEDIDSGLHPTRIRLLVEFLEAVTHERDIQVIATTHSPVVLQWLSDESLRNAIVFGRIPDHEGTIMRRLGDLPYFNEVVERTGIDEMFTTGWLEMAL